LKFDETKINSASKTRKLSYRKRRKDDRAVRDAPYMWVFSRVSEYARAATCPEIFNGLLFRSILWMFVQNLKFVA